MVGVALIAVISLGGSAGILFTGQVAEEAVTETPETTEASAPKQAERPRRIRADEREILKEQNQEVERLGREIERLQEAAVEGGNENISFEELKAQAEARLFQGSASYAQQMPPNQESSSWGSANMQQFGTPQETMQQPQRVCFAQDGSVTADRALCDGDQSRHFGMDSAAMSNGQPMGYAVPSYTDVSGYMNQQFSPPAPPTLPTPPSGLRTPSYDHAPRDPGETIELTNPGEMTFILQMMETVMMQKLPQVFAILTDAGISIPEADAIYQKSVALFTELKGPCGDGVLPSCFRMSEIADLMMGMRPLMEQAIMSSGNWMVGMKIGQIMEGAGPPPGMHGAPQGMMPPQGGSGYGGHGPPSGYGNYGGGYDQGWQQ